MNVEREITGGKMRERDLGRAIEERKSG